TSQADVDGFDPSLIWQYDAFSSIQDGIDAVAGSTVNVRPGTYNERLTINKSLDLRGAQYGVDPTAAGARTNPANESIVDVTVLAYANPDIAVEIASGVSDVTMDGFTLIGDPTNPLADTSVIRCWANNVTIRNNIIDGKYDVLYKGGDTLTVDHNRMVVNKVGVTVQPNLATNVTVSDNVFTLGPSPATDAAAIYMTSCSQCSVTGNAATDFINGNGLGGSNLGHLTVSGNTFTGNRKGVNIWGSSTYITISDNNLSRSGQCGIEIKGQDIDITGNTINNNSDSGIKIARHVIDTQRVAIHQNNITGNTNYGVWVDITAVSEIIDAACNWWGAVNGPSGFGSGSGDAVSDNVAFQPWLTQEAPSACDHEGPLTHNVAPATVAVNTPVILTANVDDTTTGGSNIASAEYNLDDGGWVAMSAQDGSFDDVSETVEATIEAFGTAGIHEVCVQGTDAAGNTGPEECILLVVYDPEGGFVTGGGWIWSPAGAYYPDDTLEGKATFGFVSKYKKGAQIPEGQTEFVFKVADLNFHSDNYEWLVVAGAKAQFKGTGTINDAGNYGFMLTAIDAELTPSAEVDKFRIKIWDKDADELVYDNQIDAADDADPTTEIGGGSIVIHTSKK
ncbi:MAG: right-handed parallel beta-helix repeat-containing protein, partial [Anaerolineae bacterium]|nr:right-handed parallel beta-helix repeat-containing protein [Anaerolineae bacterium]